MTNVYFYSKNRLMLIITSITCAEYEGISFSYKKSIITSINNKTLSCKLYQKIYCHVNYCCKNTKGITIIA